MTEREYVETLLRAAGAYQDALRGIPEDHEGKRQAIECWWGLKQKISPFLLVEMCNLWLASK